MKRIVVALSILAVVHCGGRSEEAHRVHQKGAAVMKAVKPAPGTPTRQQQSEKLRRSMERANRIVRASRLTREKTRLAQKSDSLALARGSRRGSTMPYATVFGKKTHFLRAPALPSVFQKHPANRIQTTNLLIDGKSADTVGVGSSPLLTFDFAPGYVSATIRLFVDLNANGILDASDPPGGDAILLVDNDDFDLNKTDGKYELSLQDNFGITFLQAALLIEINDYQSSAVASVVVRADSGNSQLIIHLSPAIPGMGVAIPNSMFSQLAFADSSGRATIRFDRTNPTNEVVVYDPFGVTDSLITSSRSFLTFVSDTLDTTIYLQTATTFLRGYVRDEGGNPVVGAVIDFSSNAGGDRTVTDSLGHFNSGIVPGLCWFTLMTPSPQYVLPNVPGGSLEIPPGGSKPLELTVPRANTTIQGAVRLGAVGLGGVPIIAICDSFGNMAMTVSGGTYVLPVYSSTSQPKGHEVRLDAPQAGYFAPVTVQTDVPAGATNVDFGIVRVTGGIQGYVRDAATMLPIAGAAIDAMGENEATGFSNDSGYYRMSLPPGVYGLEASALRYYDVFNGGIFISGSMVTTDILLTRSGSIAGTIRGPGNVPISDAEIFVVGVGSGTFRSTSSEVDGHYVVSPLDGGQYLVYVSVAGYLSTWYPNALTEFDAQEVSVANGAETPNIDITLSRGGSFSGTVTDSHGAALPGSTVTAFDSTFAWMGSTQSGADGRYTLSGLTTGTFYARASHSDFAWEWYNGAPVPDDATPIHVVINSDQPGISFSLTRSARISGTVTDRHAVPLTNATVAVFDSALSIAGIEWTGYDGSYGVQVGLGGTYFLRVQAIDYATWWYDSAATIGAATPIHVASEEWVSGIDLQVPRASGIAGTVKTTDGSPVVGTFVAVYDSTDTWEDYAWTTSGGSYTISSLPPGRYRAGTDVSSFHEQWYDHKSSLAEADWINLGFEEMRSGINFDLSPRASLMGQVLDDSTGDPIDTAIVVATDLSYYSLNAFSVTSDGRYYLNVPGGSYYVRAFPYKQSVEYTAGFAGPPGTGFPMPGAVVHVTGEYAPVTAAIRLKRNTYHASIDASHLALTLTNQAQLGVFEDPGEPSGRWPISSSRNFLYEGDLWVGSVSGSDTVVTGSMYLGRGNSWFPYGGFERMGRDSASVLRTFCDDSRSSPPFGGIGIAVRTEASAWPGSDYVILHYTLLYTPVWGLYHSTIDNLFVGIFADFDIAEVSSHDLIGVDPARALVYQYDAGGVTNTCMGVALLNRTPARLSWWKSGTDPFTPQEEYVRLASGPSPALPASADDYRSFVSAGPFSLAPGDSIDVAFAIVAGAGADAVKAAATAAQSRESATGIAGGETRSIPTQFELGQNYPNPFNPSTTISFGLPRASHVTLQVYDLIGRCVATVIDAEREAGYYKTRWEAKNSASGLYFYTLRAGEFTQTRKMLLLR